MLDIMSHIKHFFSKYGIYLIILCIGIAFRIGAIINKNNVFWDDPISIAVSTPNNVSPEGRYFKYGWHDYLFETGKDYEAIDIKKALFQNDSSFISIFNDIKSITFHNIDIQHTNFYYSILRIWNAGITGTSSREIMNRGYSLNIVFFIFSFFFLYKLLELISKEKSFMLTGLILYSFSCATISNTLLIRPYALMECMFLLSTYLFLLLYNCIKNNEFEKYLTFKNVLLLSFGFALAANSGYIIAVYLLLLFIALITKSITSGNKYKAILPLLKLIPFILLFVLILYPKFFNISDSVRLEQSINGFSLYSLFNLKNNALTLFALLIRYVYYNFHYIFILYFLCLLGFNLKNNDIKVKGNKLVYLIVMLALLWAYISLSVLGVTPNIKYYDLRVIMPAVSILLLIIIPIFQNFKLVYFKLFLLIYILSSYLSIINYHNNIFSAELMDANYNITNELFYPADNNLPVVFYGNQPELFATYIFDLPNDTKIRFEKDTPTSNYLYDNIIILSESRVALNPKHWYCSYEILPIAGAFNHCMKKK